MSIYRANDTRSVRSALPMGSSPPRSHNCEDTAGKAPRGREDGVPAAARAVAIGAEVCLNKKTQHRLSGNGCCYLSFFSLPEVRWLLTNPKEVPLNMNDTPTAPLFPKGRGERKRSRCQRGRRVAWRAANGRKDGQEQAWEGGEGREQRGRVWEKGWDGRQGPEAEAPSGDEKARRMASSPGLSAGPREEAARAPHPGISP